MSNFTLLEEDPYQIVSPNFVSGCILHAHYVEGVQAIIQATFAVCTIPLTMVQVYLGWVAVIFRYRSSKWIYTIKKGKKSFIAQVSLENEKKKD